MVIYKNCKFFSYIKLGIENGEELRWKFWAEYFEGVKEGWMGGWVGGWMAGGWVEKPMYDSWGVEGWMDGWKFWSSFKRRVRARAGLRIAYSNQKYNYSNPS